MDKNATPLDLSKMPLTAPAASDPVVPPPQPKPVPPPALPTMQPASAAPVAPPPVVPPLSHDIHNGGPVAPPLTPPPAAAARPSSMPLIAIIPAILVLAAVAAAGAFYIVKQHPTSRSAQAPLAHVEPTPKPIFIQVLSPEGEIDMVNGELLVAGNTLPNTAVSVWSDIDDSVVESDAAGHFETTIAIDEAGGAIQISAYSPTGDESSRIIQVGGQAVLGKSDAPGQNKEKKAGENGNEKSSTSTPTPTRSAESKKPQKAIDQMDQDAFLAVKVKEQSTKLGIKKFKEILANPTGSGSAAMVRKVIEAKPATTSAVLKRHGLMGVITGLSANSITIRHQNDLRAADTIFFNINTVIQSENDKSTTAIPFAIGDRINAVGYPSPQGLLATRIHIIPGNPIDVVTIFGITPTLAVPAAVGSPSATPADPAATAAPILPTATLTVTPPPASPTESPL